MKRVLGAFVTLAMIVVASMRVLAAEDEPRVVAQWNSLAYKISDPKIAERWQKSQIYGKALVQGVKIDSKGNFYVTTARWGGPEIPATLSMLVKNGETWELVPFPSEEMNDVTNPRGLKAVLGFEIDRDDVMWILDQGHIAGKPSMPGDEKLILYDLKTNKEIGRYEFPDAVTDKKCSFLNDVSVDGDSGFAYISDSGIFCDPLHGGLIIYDRKANTARRVFDRSEFTNDEPNFFFNVGDRKSLKNTGMRTGADGIALSGDKKTLYWTNLTGNHLYSIDTGMLRDAKLADADLKKAVRLATVLPSNTDGLTADRDGNIYLTALMLNSVMKYDTVTGKLTRVAYHPEMVLPDTLGWGANGALYVSSNHLNTWVDGDMNFTDPPVPNFRIWKLPVKATPYLAK